MHKISVAVGEDLHFDVPRSRQIPLQQQRSVAEAAFGQATRSRQRLGDLSYIANNAHALAATAGSGLDDQWHTETPRLTLQMTEVLISALVSRQYRHTLGTHTSLGDDLRAHGANGSRRRSHEDQSGVDTGLRELRVLGKEPVSGVNRL